MRCEMRERERERVIERNSKLNEGNKNNFDLRMLFVNAYYINTNLTRILTQFGAVPTIFAHNQILSCPNFGLACRFADG